MEKLIDLFNTLWPAVGPLAVVVLGFALWRAIPRSTRPTHRRRYDDESNPR